MPDANPKRILFADDHPLVLSGLKSAIMQTADLEWLGAVHTCVALKSRLQKEPVPDLALIDIWLADGIVFTVLHDLFRQNLLPAFAILTGSRDWSHLNQAQQAGAKGYILKEEKPEAIVDSIRRILKGELVFPAGTGSQSEQETLSPDLVKAYHSLSKREKQLLLYIARGYLNREIGEYLNISIRTVENHRARIAEKLGARSPVQLTTMAIQLRDLLENDS